MRLVLDHEKDHPSRWAAVSSVASKIGCSAHTLNEWVKKAEVESGSRAGVPLDVLEKLKAQEREIRELRQANEISAARPRLILRWRSSTADRNDAGFHRAPGTRGRADLQGAADRPIDLAAACGARGRSGQAAGAGTTRCRLEIRRVFEENLQVYGVRKVWRQLQREGIQVARCTVARLMREMGLRGAIRGKPVKTTIADKGLPCPLDRVNRQFRADRPDQLWLCDFTYVSTWSGFVYVAFIIDAFARRIVGWRVSRTADAGFVLDALEQALHQRRPAGKSGLHSDRGSQYLSIRYTERLGLAGIEPAVSGTATEL